MTVKELIEMIKSREDWEEIVCIELYEFVDKSKSFHTDCIKYIDEYGERYADCKVVDWSVMDCEEMNHTLYANSCVYAEDIYGADGKVLAIAIEEDGGNDE